MTLGIEQFQWAAETLGLRLDEPSGFGRITLDGTLEGQRVSIRQWRGDFVWVEFEAFLDPPADLHLHIGQVGVISKIAALFGKHDIEVGNPEFDAAFDIKAQEPERARALLNDGVQKVLLPWKNAGDLFHVDDAGVHLSVRPGSYSTLDGETIVRNARAAAFLAHTIAGALRDVPPSRHLAAHVESWRSFASAHGLSFSGSPLHMSGVLTQSEYRGAGAVPFAARVAPVSKDEYGVELRVRIEPRLPFHLRIRPAHWYDFAERTGDSTHAKTGDAAFDDALRVTTGAPEPTRRLLDEPMRAALLALHREHAGIVLDHDELVVRTKTMIDPSEFGKWIEQAAGVARELATKVAR